MGKLQKKQHNISVNSCPKSGDHRYDKIYERFVMGKFPNLYKNWHHYMASKSFYHAMDGLGIFHDYKDFVETRVDFLCPALTNDAVAHTNHSITTMTGSFKDTLDSDMLKIVMMESLRFVVPVTPVPEERPTPWLFATSDKNVQWLKAPMGGSVVYRPKRKSAEGDVGAVTPKKKVKKSRTTTEGNFSEEKMDVNVTAGGQTREKCFLDDLVACLLAPLDQLQQEQRSRICIQRCLRLGLEFLWSGTVEINGKMYSAWSKLRKALREEVIRGHLAAFRQLPGLVDANTASSEDIASAVLAALGPDDDGRAGASSASSVKAREMEMGMQPFTSDQDFIISVSSFLHTDPPSLSEKLQPAFLRLVQDIVDDLSSRNHRSSLSIKTLLSNIKEKVFDVFTERWASFGKRVIDHMSKAESEYTAADVSAGILKTTAEMDACFRQRTRYILALLDIMATGDSKITERNYSREVGLLFEHIDAIAYADISTGKEFWLSLWEMVIESATRNDVCATLRAHACGSYSDETSVRPEPEASTSSTVQPAQQGGDSAKQGLAGWQSLASLRSQWRLSDTSVGGPVIVNFMQKLEAFVYENTMVNTGMGTNLLGLTPDRGYDSVFVKACDKDQKLYARTMSENLVLNFSGKVSRVPAKGSIHIARCFGSDFYLEEGGFSSAHKSDGFVPAWMMRCAGTSKGVGAANMQVNIKEAGFRFAYATVGKTNSITTNVKFYYLTPMTKSVGLTSCQGVELVREAIDAQIKVVPKAKRLAKSGREVGSATWAHKDPAYASAKHIFS